MEIEKTREIEKYDTLKTIANRQKDSMVPWVLTIPLTALGIEKRR